MREDQSYAKMQIYLFMEKENGISHFHAGYIMSFYGVSSMLGRLIGGIYTSYVEKGAVLHMASCMLLMGSSCLAIASSTLYWQFVISILIFGVSQGMFVVLRTVPFA